MAVGSGRALLARPHRRHRAAMRVPAPPAPEDQQARDRGEVSTGEDTRVGEGQRSHGVRAQRGELEAGFTLLAVNRRLPVAVIYVFRFKILKYKSQKNGYRYSKNGKIYSANGKVNPTPSSRFVASSSQELPRK